MQHSKRSPRLDSVRRVERDSDGGKQQRSLEASAASTPCHQLRRTPPRTFFFIFHVESQLLDSQIRNLFPSSSQVISRLETSSPLAMDQIFGFVEPFLQEPTLLVAQSIIQHFVMIACRQLQILHFTDAVPPVLTCNYAVTPVFTTPLQNEEHVSSPMPVVDPFWLDLGGWRRVLYPVWRLQAHLYSRALHLAFTPISSRPPQLWSG